MLVPAPRLLWLVALIVVPAATLFGAMPAVAPVFAATISLVVLAATFDATLTRNRLNGLAVETPPVVHGTKGRSSDLVATLAGNTMPLTVGLRLPDERIQCETAIQRIKSGEKAVTWTIQTPRRGLFRLGTLHFETSSPLGLWKRRRTVPFATELRIYPDLRADRRGLAAVFLNRGGLGIHARPQLGKGREFDHLREYAPGDDYGDIHWKSTARRGHPVTKTFQIERTREVYVIIDHSRLTARPAAGDDPTDTTLERCLQSALVLGLAAQQQHDLFGLVTFADQVTTFRRSGSGRGHYNACRDALYTLEPRLVSPHFEELFIFLRKTLTRRALLIFLTDLSDAIQAESFIEGIKLVARHHLALVAMIRPPLARPLFSRSEVATTDDVYEDLGGHFLWRDLQEVRKVLGQAGVQFILPDRPALTADIVSEYMAVKQRQQL